MNVQGMTYEIKKSLDEGLSDLPYDWDDMDDLPEEMLTIDNLLAIVKDYQSKYNWALEEYESRMLDIDATINFYEERHDLGLD